MKRLDLITSDEYLQVNIESIIRPDAMVESMRAEATAFIKKHIAERIGIVESTSPAQEWISVKDRLPKNDDSILLSTGSIVFCGWAEQEVDTDKYARFYFGGNQQAFGVTHWQPLPKPPIPSK